MFIQLILCLEALKIILTTTLLAIIYGICHDLVTAHLSVEYFTVGHPIIIQSTEPVALALAWGVVATWWGGLLMGILIALAARLGSAPKLVLGDVVRPMGVLLAVMAGSALVAGLLGYVLTRAGVFYLVDHLAVHIAPERHHLFLTAGWAHGASYIVGFVGSAVLGVRLWRRRKALTAV